MAKFKNMELKISEDLISYKPCAPFISVNEEGEEIRSTSEKIVLFKVSNLSFGVDKWMERQEIIDAFNRVLFKNMFKEYKGISYKKWKQEQSV